MVTPLLLIEISYLEQRIPQFDQLNGLVVRKVESRKLKVESRKLKVDLIQFYFQNSCFLNKVALLLLIFQLFSMVTFPKSELSKVKKCPGFISARALFYILSARAISCLELVLIVYE